MQTAGFGGFIGFDFSSLDFLLRTYKVPEEDWIFVLDKLLELNKLARILWAPKKAENATS